MIFVTKRGRHSGGIFVLLKIAGFDLKNSEAFVKRILKTIVCVAIGAVVATPSVSLAQSPDRNYTPAQLRKIRECRSRSGHADIIRETATGAAIGAVGGALTGNAGKGAIVGAGVGAADSATSHSGNVGRGALTGGAIGAVGGAITGNTGRGALIGAGVGAANRALRGNDNCR